MIPAENHIQIPFEEGNENDCTELLRLWITERNTIACSADVDAPDCGEYGSIFGVAISELARQMAAGAAQIHGIDEEEFLQELTDKLLGALHG